MSATAITTNSATATLGHATAARPNLGDVVVAVKGNKALSQIRRRDLCSAVKRVAELLGQDPARIALDVPAIGAKLAAISPRAIGLTGKSFGNIRSNFMAAVKASGLQPIRRRAKAPLSAAWKEFMAGLSARRAHIGLSRLARHASAEAIEPGEVDDATIAAFIAAVRTGTLHRKPNGLHRKVALIWNEAAQTSRFALQSVEVPSFRLPAGRIAWSTLPPALRKDADDYLAWCAGRDAFSDTARSRPLAPRTIKLRQDQIHAAVTALVESGVKPRAITSLAALVSPKNFRRILRRRHETVGGRENVFNHDLARSLVRLAREWVKPGAETLAELARLAGKVPTPIPGLTSKNKAALRQFDDPATLRRLFDFPSRLFAEVERETKPNARTLVKAQAAIAVAILCYIPLRLQNLATLAFDVHLFVREGRGATSSLELPADEVKNRRDLAFDIPPHIAKMLIAFRNRIAPRILGDRPDKLFVNADGTAKTQWTVAWTIRTYLRKRAGVVLSAHQFRHLAAKTLLDAEPGNFETVRQFLGHSNLQTTVAAYAGVDSRRAARHHQRLVEEALAAQEFPPRRRSGRPAS